MSPNGRQHSQSTRLPVAAGDQGAPSKKIAETNAIFDNIHAARERARRDPCCLRISIDGKAKVSIGPFSRRGRARGKASLKACDHDTQPVAMLRPFGVLEVARGEQEIQQLWLAFGHSRETSDFIVDVLEMWWPERRASHRGVRRLQIELDNGPQLSSSRTQFLKRMQAFADHHGLEERNLTVNEAKPQAKKGGKFTGRRDRNR